MQNLPIQTHRTGAATQGYKIAFSGVPAPAVPTPKRQSFTCNVTTGYGMGRRRLGKGANIKAEDRNKEPTSTSTMRLGKGRGSKGTNRTLFGGTGWTGDARGTGTRVSHGRVQKRSSTAAAAADVRGGGTDTATRAGSQNESISEEDDVIIMEEERDYTNVIGNDHAAESSLMRDIFDVPDPSKLSSKPCLNIPKPPNQFNWPSEYNDLDPNLISLSDFEMDCLVEKVELYKSFSLFKDKCKCGKINNNQINKQQDHEDDRHSQIVNLKSKQTRMEPKSELNIPNTTTTAMSSQSSLCVVVGANIAKGDLDLESSLDEKYPFADDGDDDWMSRIDEKSLTDYPVSEDKKPNASLLRVKMKTSAQPSLQSIFVGGCNPNKPKFQFQKKSQNVRIADAYKSSNGSQVQNISQTPNGAKNVIVPRTTATSTVTRLSPLQEDTVSEFGSKLMSILDIGQPSGNSVNSGTMMATDKSQNKKNSQSSESYNVSKDEFRYEDDSNNQMGLEQETEEVEAALLLNETSSEISDGCSTGTKADFLSPVQTKNRHCNNGKSETKTCTEIITISDAGSSTHFDESVSDEETGLWSHVKDNPISLSKPEEKQFSTPTPVSFKEDMFPEDEFGFADDGDDAIFAEIQYDYTPKPKTESQDRTKDSSFSLSLSPPCGSFNRNGNGNYSQPNTQSGTIQGLFPPQSTPTFGSSRGVNKEIQMPTTSRSLSSSFTAVKPSIGLIPGKDDNDTISIASTTNDIKSVGPRKYKFQFKPRPSSTFPSNESKVSEWIDLSSAKVFQQPKKLQSGNSKSSLTTAGGFGISNAKLKPKAKFSSVIVLSDEDDEDFVTRHAGAGPSAPGNSTVSKKPLTPASRNVLISHKAQSSPPYLTRNEYKMTYESIAEPHTKQGRQRKKCRLDDNQFLDIEASVSGGDDDSEEDDELEGSDASFVDDDTSDDLISESQQVRYMQSVKDREIAIRRNRLFAAKAPLNDTPPIVEEESMNVDYEIDSFCQPDAEVEYDDEMGVFTQAMNVAHVKIMNESPKGIKTRRQARAKQAQDHLEQESSKLLPEPERNLRKTRKRIILMSSSSDED